MGIWTQKQSKPQRHIWLIRLHTRQEKKRVCELMALRMAGLEPALTQRERFALEFFRLQREK